MTRYFARSVCLTCVLFLVPAVHASQTPTPTPTPPEDHSSSDSNFIKNIARDQKAIWTSPFHIRKRDTKWVVPFLVGSGVLIATDEETSEHIARNGDLPGFSHKVSWFGGAYATTAMAAGMYLLGRATHRDKLRETGMLSAEALIDTFAVTEVSKYGLGRLRPNEDPGGHFFHGGRSFFSGHASSSWAIATIVACEYGKSPWARVGAYAGAAAVSLSRLSGRNHFLSDIFVGAGVGYGIGRFVCRNRSSNAGSMDSDTLANGGWKHPIPSPYFDPRTRTYGARLTWSF